MGAHAESDVVPVTITFSSVGAKYVLVAEFWATSDVAHEGEGVGDGVHWDRSREQQTPGWSSCGNSIRKPVLLPLADVITTLLSLLLLAMVMMKPFAFVVVRVALYVGRG